MSFVFRNENNKFFSFLLFESIQSKRDVEKLVDEINEGRPQCPVGLNTLVIPRKIALNEHMNQPYVYLNCGHVQGKQNEAKITREREKTVYIIKKYVGN